MRLPLTCLLLAACGPGDRDTSVDAPSQGDAGSNVDAPPAVDTSRIYAHAPSPTEGQPDKLYRLNNATFAPSEIGAITGLETQMGVQHLQDLAVDSGDRMIGVTRDRLFTIDQNTGAATFKADLGVSGFSSLSFIPDPANGPDLLISANDLGDVYSIDPDNGTATLVGNYGMKNGKQIKSSGDLFGVVGYGIFATVDLEGETEDYLASVDPMNNWKATVIGSGTGFDRIYGLGFWNGKIFGFVDETFEVGTGKVVEIDKANGVGTVKNSGSIRWFGAGVATDAPIL